jgi:hypothetical protein
LLRPDGPRLELIGLEPHPGELLQGAGDSSEPGGRLPVQCYGTSSFTVGKYVVYRWESRVRIVIPSTAAWAPI